MPLVRNWEKIDKRAQQATQKDADTYADLMSFLEEPIRDDIDRDIYITRAIIYWMFCNEDTNLTDSEKSSVDPDSPLLLITRMHSGKIAYADAFETLCKKAKLKCETVEGISKSGNYQVGDMDVSKMTATWNKVILEGAWWPVYPRWVLRNLVGAAHKDFKPIELEAKRPHDAQDTVHMKTNFTEFWFLTDPEIFIYKCYPDNIGDQMLPKSKQIRKQRQFLKLPHLTLHFFQANLKLTSDDSCIVDSDEGICKVSFKADKSLAKNLVFEYTVYIKDSQNMKDFSKEHDIPRLVMNSRKNGHFMFEVRCPIEGTYMLEIKGGHAQAVNKKVYLVTRIICRERLQNIRPLPIDAGKTGFGHGPVATNAGLTKAAIKEPKIAIHTKKGESTNNEKVDFKFALDKDLVNEKDFAVELHGLGKSTEELKDFVHIKKDIKNLELTVTASVPDNGEYALVVTAADRKVPGEEQKFEPVVNYLLTTLEEKEQVEEDYYDSSDGLSDIDDAIDDMENKIVELKTRRDQLLESMNKRPVGLEE